jgi:hypothetical protein
MRSGVGCSHCHALVWTDGPTWPDCPTCGHRADRPRIACDCPTCVAPRPLDALRARVRRRVLALDGDTEGWS